MQTEASNIFIEVSQHNSETTTQWTRDSSSRMDPKLKLSIIFLSISIPCLILIQMIKYRRQWVKFCKEQSLIVEAEKREQEISRPPKKYEVAINMPKPNDSTQYNNDFVVSKDIEKSTFKLSNSGCFLFSNSVHDETTDACYVHRMNPDLSLHLHQLPTYDEFMEFSRKHKFCNCHNSKDTAATNT